jgi:hypothetical protein
VKPSNTLASVLLSAVVLTVPIAASAQANAPGMAGADLQSNFKLVTTSSSIARESAGQILLANGETIYLNDGTVIKPGDASLTGAARITVTGYANDEDGSINATEIDVEKPAR